MGNHLTDRAIVPRGGLPRMPLSRTKVGKVEAPLSATLDDVRAYVAAMDAALDALWADTKAQLVWIDPADVSKWGSGPDVEALVERAAARGPAQAVKDIDFSRRLNQFRTVDWPAAKAGITIGMDGKVGPGVTYAPPSTRWNRVRDQHVKVADKYTEFRSLGGSPSADPGPAPEPIDKTDPGFVAGKVAKALPWWVWPVAITAGGVAGYVYLVRPLILARKATA